MGLTGKLVAAIEFRAGGDVYHDLFKYNPHHISTISPDKIHGCQLHEGEFGKVGSLITWTYTHDGKMKICKEVIEAVDEEKKTVVFKVIEGDLLELYKDFVFTFHVDTKDGIDLVTWTLDYESLNDDVEHPISLLAFIIDFTKDIETHHLQKKA